MEIVPVRPEHETLNIVTVTSDKVKLMRPGSDKDIVYLFPDLSAAVTRGVRAGMYWKEQSLQRAGMDLTEICKVGA